MALIGSSSWNATPNDTIEISPNAGFIPDVTGVLTCRLRNDTANRTMPVNAGQYYPFDLKLMTTATTGVTTITVIRGEQRGG